MSKLPTVSPSDLVLSGTVLGVQNDKISYVSKKTGLHNELIRQVLVLQCPFGIVLVRAFNSLFDYSSIPVGEKADIPISEYRLDNGVKTAVVKS